MDQSSHLSDGPLDYPGIEKIRQHFYKSWPIQKIKIFGPKYFFRDGINALNYSDLAEILFKEAFRKIDKMEILMNLKDEES